MKKAILSIFIVIFAGTALYAAEDDSEEPKSAVILGSGLTRKQIGNFSVVAAEDANVTTDGKQAFVENIYEYVGRKFKETEARLKKIEGVQEEMRKRIKHLEKNFSKMKKTALSTERIY